MSRSTNGGGQDLLRWEIAAGHETIVEQLPSGADGAMSPDGRWLTRWIKQNIEIRPTSGGDWKSAVSFGKELPMGTGHFNITPDGNWLLFHDLDSTGKHGLFRVATAGGAPERLGDFPTNSRLGSIQTEGR